MDSKSYNPENELGEDFLQFHRNERRKARAVTWLGANSVLLALLTHGHLMHWWSMTLLLFILCNLQLGLTVYALWILRRAHLHSETMHTRAEHALMELRDRKEFPFTSE